LNRPFSTVTGSLSLIPVESSGVSETTNNDETLNIAGVLLAAGTSSRLGQPKQLVDYNGVSLVCHAARHALGYCDAGLTVVTGAHHDEVLAALGNLPVRVVGNPGWREGIGSSIRQGVQSVAPDVRAILLMVCDQPMVNSRDLRRLLEAWKCRPGFVAASAYAGTKGVPAIFPSGLRKELLNLNGDHGAKKIIDAADDVSVVEMPNASFDVDTPDHLDKLKS
jgi:molybdenum cofactor cytidylyltransferase